LATEFGNKSNKNVDLETIKTEVAAFLSKFAQFDGVDMRLTIGDRLRNARNDAKISTKELSRLSSVCCKTITGIEHNRHQPTIKTALKLATILKISVAVLAVKPDEFFSKDLRIQLKVLRLSLGLTQQEFANLCGIAPSTIRDWELVKREMNDSNRKLVSELLNQSQNVIAGAKMTLCGG